MLALISKGLTSLSGNVVVEAGGLILLDPGATAGTEKGEDSPKIGRHVGG